MKKDCLPDFYQFIYLSLGLSIVLFLLVLFGAPLILDSLSLENQVAVVAKHYLMYLSLGIIPLLLFSVVRSLLDALGLTPASPCTLMLLLLPLNAGFNYALIYGAFGFPEMGGAGAGLGTSIAYWVLLFISVLILIRHPKLKSYSFGKDKRVVAEGIKEGITSGFTNWRNCFAEVVIFFCCRTYHGQVSINGDC